MFRVLFLYRHKHIGRFSNLHQCTVFFLVWALSPPIGENAVVLTTPWHQCTFKSLGNLRGKKNAKSIILEIKSCFTCGESNFHGSTITLQNIIYRAIENKNFISPCNKQYMCLGGSFIKHKLSRNSRRCSGKQLQQTFGEFLVKHVTGTPFNKFAKFKKSLQIIWFSGILPIFFTAPGTKQKQAFANVLQNWCF